MPEQTYNETRHVHVIGAGMAGISAAMHASHRGFPVSLYERSNLIGGRCRSYEDKQLNCLIDNGNHLMMSGNADILRLLDWAGATDRLHMAETARYAFVDVDTRERWVLEIDKGRWPGWLLDPERRVPGTRIWDYRGLLGILLNRDNQPLAVHLDRDSVLYHRFWEPLILAVMNLPPEQADTGLLRRVLLETVMRGGEYSRPMIARTGLGPDLVDPCVEWLGMRGTHVQFRKVLTGLTMDDDRITELQFKDADPVTLNPDDAVILAVPPYSAATLLPGLVVPEEGEPILNLHFAVPNLNPAVLGTFPVIGLVGTIAQWVFVREGLASVTISAARNLPADDDAALAERIWQEIAPVLEQSGDSVPAYRLIREKRATFTQTLENVRKRPGSYGPPRNLWLAGDWIDTGLPATIEGAARSGRMAVESLVQTVP